MNGYTDRCAAVTAALQDLARDLEADLGKIARFRGTADASTSHVAHFRDPGPDVATFERQKTDYPSTSSTSVGTTLYAYRAAANDASQMVHISAPASEDRAARDGVLALIEAIQAVETHDDAIALVATFTEGA